jgi:long-chain acyl-CoA synthetase
MKYEPTTLLELTERGLKKNTTNIVAETKRFGKWHRTDIDDFRSKVKYFALGLYQLGVRPGDKVALHSESCTEWLICDHAILSLGATNVPIYATQPGEQIKYILENSEAKVYIVYNDKLFESVKPMIKGIESVKGVVNILETSHGKLKSMDDVIRMGRAKDDEDPDLFDQLKSKIKPDDLASLIYTSGTTGVPKGAMITHNNIASNVLSTIEHAPFDVEVDRGGRMLSYLPLSHVLERMGTYMYLYIGYPIYFIEDLENFMGEMQEVKPIFFITVPRLLEKVHAGIKEKGQELSGIKKSLFYWAIGLAENFDVEHPPKGLQSLKLKFADKVVYTKIREAFGGKMIGIISGGAALSPLIMNFFNAIGIYCSQGYGLTETSPVLTVGDPGHMRPGSVGPAIDDVQLKIAEDGEILAKGPNVMKGYYKLPEETENAFTEDGWFRTGDIGKIDNDGYLYITDRKKALFKLSTGKYVAPQPIENALVDSPYVDQAMVIGNQRKFCSALIIPDYNKIRTDLEEQGTKLPEGDLSDNETIIKLIQKEVDHVNKDLPKWEKVKKFKLMKEPFTIDKGELTPTLKMKRPKILDIHSEKIESIYREAEQVGK